MWVRCSRTSYQRIFLELKESKFVSKQRRYNIAVIGATGTVGEILLTLLAERNFPVRDLVPLASERSAGSVRGFAGKQVKIQKLEGYDFRDIDLAFFSADEAVSGTHVPRAVEAGAIVIDNTSAFRYRDDIPLVIPEVNAHAIEQYENRGIIANPNCATIQLLVALAPIHRAAGITKINVATYQSVSGVGRAGMEELGRQSAALLGFQEVKPKHFPKQIAFNVIPHIDDFQSNGYTREEMKLVWETHKILENNAIQVNPTAVRVPVFYGHAEAVHLETKVAISASSARLLLTSAEGVMVYDECCAGGYPTPVGDVAGKNPVFVGRIRESLSGEHGLNLWIVADNTRKGAALNAVQIAEKLIEKYL